jgi:hypothetical protein
VQTLTLASGEDHSEDAHGSLDGTSSAADQELFNSITNPGRTTDKQGKEDIDIVDGAECPAILPGGSEKA